MLSCAGRSEKVGLTQRDLEDGHGRHDELIPISDSRRLAETGGLETMLWEVDDGHRMRSILETGVLSKAVEWLLSPESWAATRLRR